MMTNETKDPSIDVVGIGNAIVDVLTTTDDALLEKLSFDKGSMTLIDENKAKELYKIATNGIQKSGGSVANSLACIAQLGGKASFIGRVRFQDSTCFSGPLNSSMPNFRHARRSENNVHLLGRFSSTRT